MASAGDSRPIEPTEKRDFWNLSARRRRLQDDACNLSTPYTEHQACHRDMGCCARPMDRRSNPHLQRERCKKKKKIGKQVWPGFCGRRHKTLHKWRVPGQGGRAAVTTAAMWVTPRSGIKCFGAGFATRTMGLLWTRRIQVTQREPQLLHKLTQPGLLTLFKANPSQGKRLLGARWKESVVHQQCDCVCL